MNNMIFLNVGWMRFYKGLANDSIIGGGSYIYEHGYGHEIFNFQPFNGHLYGFVQVTGSINLERLGASKDDDSIKDVTAVWVGRNPEGGRTYIIGWYTHATIYKRRQLPPVNSGREYKGEKIGYLIVAKEEDGKLLTDDERNFDIPRKRLGMGQANIWYADKPENNQFRNDVQQYINTRRMPPSGVSKGQPRQPDPYKRLLVERKAVEQIVAYYQAFGYTVNSVEKDNVGWDLEASFGEKILRLEVKGLSQNQVVTELTPNEYANMLKYKDSYRICIVVNTLSDNPQKRIFSFSPESQTWEDNMRSKLTIIESVSARITSE